MSTQTTSRPSNSWPPDLEALRSAADNVGKEFWFNEPGTPDVYSGPDKVAVCEAWRSGRRAALTEFIARANPATILYLLSKLESSAP